jgi:protein-disulfide isomerase
VFEKYPDEVKLVFKNYPLRKHRYAKIAAVAALAAERQGKFWEFHDRLFANYDRLSDVQIVEIALELGLDLDRLEKDMQDLLLVVRINQDIRHGVKAGVRGTPTVLINGRFSKARTLEELQAAVEKELERVKKERVVKSGRDCEASKRQP